MNVNDLESKCGTGILPVISSQYSSLTWKAVPLRFIPQNNTPEPGGKTITGSGVRFAADIRPPIY